MPRDDRREKSPQAPPADRLSLLFPTTSRKEDRAGRHSEFERVAPELANFAQTARVRQESRFITQQLPASAILGVQERPPP